jgi:hypothetical protein
VTTSSCREGQWKVSRGKRSAPPLDTPVSARCRCHGRLKRGRLILGVRDHFAHRLSSSGITQSVLLGAFLFHASATQLFESPNSRPRASEAPSLELALFRMTSAASSTVSYTDSPARQLAVPRYRLQLGVRQLGSRQRGLCARQPVEVPQPLLKKLGAQTAPQAWVQLGEIYVRGKDKRFERTVTVIILSDSERPGSESNIIDPRGPVRVRTSRLLRRRICRGGSGHGK